MGLLGSLLSSLFGSMKKASSDYERRKEEFINSEEGQRMILEAQKRKAIGEMDKTLKEMYDMEKELSDDD